MSTVQGPLTRLMLTRVPMSQDFDFGLGACHMKLGFLFSGLRVPSKVVHLRFRVGGLKLPMLERQIENYVLGYSMHSKPQDSPTQSPTIAAHIGAFQDAPAEFTASQLTPPVTEQF